MHKVRPSSKTTMMMRILMGVHNVIRKKTKANLAIGGLSSWHQTEPRQMMPYFRWKL